MLSLECNCDDCGKVMSDGDTTYCSECWKALQEQIEELEKKVSDLENAAMEASE